MQDKERIEEFTEGARKVLSLAQEEAHRFNHGYIGTEHLLVGLIRESEGAAAKVLADLGVELRNVRSAIELSIGRGDRIVVGESSLTPRARRVIEWAKNQARQLRHRSTGTEDLLLGVIQEQGGMAAGILESLGVNLDKARDKTVQVFAQSNIDGASDEGDSSAPALSAEQLEHIQAKMQKTLHIGEHNTSESLAAAQRRAYSLARSVSELLAEISRLKEEVHTLRQSQS